MAEKAPIDRTGDFWSAWVWTGNSHRVSAIGVTPLDPRPSRRGDHERGNQRDAAEKMVYIHGWLQLSISLARCLT